MPERILKARDTETGEIVKFKWFGDSNPTDSDFDEIFKERRGRTLQPPMANPAEPRRPFRPDVNSHLGVEAQPAQAAQPPLAGAMGARSLDVAGLQTTLPELRDVPQAVGRGLAEGLTVELPRMAGDAMQYLGGLREGSPEVGIIPAGKALSNLAGKAKQGIFGDDPKYSKAGEIAYQGSKMLAPSIIPGGSIGVGARAALAGVKGLSAIEKAQVATKLAALSSGALFGTSTAQGVKETAKARGVDPGLAPEIEGAIEMVGESIGAKYLGKMLGLDAGALRVTLEGFIKTLGVEVGTEFFQQLGQSATDKISGIRPDADPLNEAIEVIGPTVFMTAMTGVGGRTAQALSPEVQKAVDRVKAKEAAGTPLTVGDRNIKRQNPTAFLTEQQTDAGLRDAGEPTKRFDDVIEKPIVQGQEFKDLPKLDTETGEPAGVSLPDRISLIDETINGVKNDIISLKSKQYKPNAKSISVGDDENPMFDGPTRRTIGQINEGKRQRGIANNLTLIEELTAVKRMLEEGHPNAEGAWQRTLKAYPDLKERYTKSLGGPDLPAPTPQTEGSDSPLPTKSIPEGRATFEVTRPMKRQLSDLGFNAKEISDMTPEEAQERLGLPENRAKIGGQPRQVAVSADITKPTTFYHGTASESDITQFGEGVVYLAPDKENAEPYANNPILSGDRKGKPRVLEVEAKPGRVKDINAIVEESLMNDGDVEATIREQAEIAKKEGYAYLRFNHPSVSDDDMKVHVAVNPKSDLSIKQAPPPPAVGKEPWEMVTVMREDGGVFVSATRGKEEGGSAIIKNLGDNVFEINEVRVLPEQRRQGLAVELYREAAKEIQKRGGKLYTGSEQTQAGKQLHEGLRQRGLLGNNERIKGAYRAEVLPKSPAPQAGEGKGGRDYALYWDEKLKLGVRAGLVQQSGWVSKAGKMTKLGEKIAESKWSELSPAAQNVLKRKIDERYKTTTNAETEEAPPAPKPKDTTGEMFSVAPEYRGLHSAPSPENGAPLHDLTGGGQIYPDDIYSPEAARYYGHGGDDVGLDNQTIGIIKSFRGKPNARVQIFRAVPNDITTKDKIAKIEREKAYIQKHGKIPPHVETNLDRNKYYDKLYHELNALKAASPKDEQPVAIQQGDWVTINRNYAKSHGDTQFGKGNYRILAKTVKASEVFTNGDSIHEFGYWQDGKYSTDDVTFGTTGGMKASDLEKGIQPLLQRFPKEIRDKITVEQSVPEGTEGRRADAQGVTTSDGRITIFADNIDSTQTAIKKVLHEIFHSGLQGVPQVEKNILLNGIWRDYQPQMKKTKWYSTYASGKLGNQYDPKTDQGRKSLAEEYIAHEFAEKKPNPTLIQRVTAWLKNALRRLFPSIRFTDNDINAYVYGMFKGIQSGVGSEMYSAAGKPLFRAVAIKIGDKVYEGRAGDNHYDVYWQLPPKTREQYDRVNSTGLSAATSMDGFVTQSGEFLSRRDSGRLVWKAESAAMREADELLFSLKSITDSPAFKKWFGKSVVTVDGKPGSEPLVVYHGTKGEFDAFDLSMAGSNNDTGMWGTGFYFSPVRSVTRGYGDRVKRVFLSLQNPLVLHAVGENWPDIVNGPYVAHSTHGESGREYSEAMRKKLIDAGYDGVIQYERHWKRGMVTPSEKVFQIVAFYPEQIKSVNNKGTFSPSSPDIRYSVEPERIGLNKAEQDRLRELTGLDKLPEAERRHWDEVLERAKADRTDASALDIADEAIEAEKSKSQRRTLTDKEHAGMVMKAAQLKNEYNALRKSIAENIEKGNLAAVEIEKNKSNVIIDQIGRLTEGARYARREAARALSIGRMMINDDTYTIADVIGRATAAKGEQLTEKETARLEKLVAEYAEMERKLKEAEDNFAKMAEERDKIHAQMLADREAVKAKRTDKAERSRERIRTERADIKKQIAALGIRVNDITGLTTEGSYLVGRLAVNYIQEGAVTLDEVVKNVLADLPDLTPQDVWQALNTRDPKRQNQASSEARKRIAHLKTQARLVLEIQDAELGIFKSYQQKQAERPDEIKALQRKLRDLRSMAYQNDAPQLERAVQTLNRLQDQLDNHYRNIKRKRPIPSDEVLLIREQMSTLRSVMHSEDQIADLNEQLRTGEFKVKPKTQKVVDPVLERRQIELKMKRRQVKMAIEDMKPMGGRRIFGEAVNTLRTLKATADISATLRQGAFLSARRPLVALKTLGTTLQAFFSTYKAEQVDNAIRSSDGQYLRDKSKLFLSELDSAPNQREEQFMSRVIEKVPVIGQAVKASNRSMVTTLNLLRVSAFDQFVNSYPNATQEELTAWADYINAASGRGDLGRFSQAANELSLAFFAPRFAISRIQTPLKLFKHWSEPRARKEIAKEYAAFAGIGMATLSLALLAGADVGDDPRESDFGKIRVGNTRIDIWGGLQQPMRFVARVGIGATDKLGWTGVELAESKKNVNPLELLGRFSAYKLAPSITLPLELYRGRTIIGQEVTPLETSVSAITPIVFDDVRDAYEQQGIGLAAATGVMTALGLGVNTYGEKTKGSAGIVLPPKGSKPAQGKPATGRPGMGKPARVYGR